MSLWVCLDYLLLSFHNLMFLQFLQFYLMDEDSTLLLISAGAYGSASRKTFSTDHCYVYDIFV